MPDTQFSKITLGADRKLTATGPYDPQLVNNAQHEWDLVGQPIVIFMVVKTDPAGFPDIVANGVGKWEVPGLGAGLPDWSGTVEAVDVPGELQVNDEVRAIGAAIQVKTDRKDPKNPPVVELATWCVPAKLTAP